MALCSGDSKSFIHKEEEEIKRSLPRAPFVCHLLTKSGYLLTDNSLPPAFSTLHQRGGDRKENVTDGRNVHL